ncbi:MAG TPA: substrate-binding domain-containing protein [Jatrophihabitantaceae bacterium]|nr:substrate-binding domain-containing protein [Jatrophihabitantaceae bacterium]
MVRARLRNIGVCVAAAVVALTACSTNSTGSSNTDTGAAGSTLPSVANSAAGNTQAAALQGDISFNDAKLAELRDKLKAALAGKSLSGVNPSVVVNVTAAYWDAAKKGVENANKELGLNAKFQEPTQMDISQQLSILTTLLSQGSTGFSVSAIQPSSLTSFINSAKDKNVPVIAIDSPLDTFKSVPLYLGTPNYEAGQNAGNAMKQLLPNGGDVAILVGSLTALNAVQRIQGFKDALKGSSIKVFQTYNDGGDANKALQNASAAYQADPNLKAFYGVYSYDGPSAGQAVQSAGKTGKTIVVADDSEPKTLAFLKAGVVQAMVLQQPYQQGYMSVYILAAMKVLGVQATMDIIKPYLSSDGLTLSSGVGLVTKANLDAYNAKLQSFGLTSS